MKLKKYLLLLFLVPFVSCTDMDIPPINIVGDDDIFGSEAGIESYIARMYSTLPMEDFRYYFDGQNLFHNNTTKYVQQSCVTGEAIGRDTRGGLAENVSYWDTPYSYIRDVNTFLETLPEYSSGYTEAQINLWTGEAYFIRGFIYYSLAKRYGGVPIVDKVIDYPATVSFEETMLYRDSEEDTWDFISSDLDKAIELLPSSNQLGRADRSAAAALKSRAMLFAGSIAKYNSDSELGDANINYNDPLTGKQICGIPADRAQDYFQQAYDATLLVDSKYQLYKGKFVAGDNNAIADNFAEIFQTNTEETIFARYYLDPDSVHAFDDSAEPKQTSSGGNSDEICPTLDFVEMFEFPNKDENGHLDIFDENGHYKLFDSPIDAFENCEPRLSATVILPMSEFKNQIIEMRRGIWTGESAATMGPLLSETENFASDYKSKYGDANSQLKIVDNFAANSPITLSDGTSMTPSGVCGLVSMWDFGNISGFALRKYLNTDPNHNTNGNTSTQTWIEIRFAEVLLNRAEAAWELASYGATTDKNGDSYLSVAKECVNDIRERAGATLLTDDLTTDIDDRDVIRKERRKELAFEHKTYWDLRRWRIMYKEQNNTRWRTIAPFYSDVDGKYFIDIKYQEARGQGSAYVFTFDTRRYYSQIPGTEITRNPNCEQNPGY